MGGWIKIDVQNRTIMIRKQKEGRKEGEEAINAFIGLATTLNKVQRSIHINK